MLQKNKENFFKLLNRSGFSFFEAVPVLHCSQSHGIVFEHSSGLKIVYSGDCRPDDNLKKRGKNATIVIHESTLIEDGQTKEAIASKHTTMEEAVETALEMDAKYLILTHFSQRYIPSSKKVAELKCTLSEKAKKFFKTRAIMAVDHLRLKIREIPGFVAFSPALNAHSLIKN